MADMTTVFICGVILPAIVTVLVFTGFILCWYKCDFREKYLAKCFKRKKTTTTTTCAASRTPQRSVTYIKDVSSVHSSCPGSRTSHVTCGSTMCQCIHTCKTLCRANHSNQGFEHDENKPKPIDGHISKRYPPLYGPYSPYNKSSCDISIYNSIHNSSNNVSSTQQSPQCTATAKTTAHTNATTNSPISHIHMDNLSANRGDFYSVNGAGILTEAGVHYSLTEPPRSPAANSDSGTYSMAESQQAATATYSPALHHSTRLNIDRTCARDRVASWQQSIQPETVGGNTKISTPHTYPAHTVYHNSTRRKADNRNHDVSGHNATNPTTVTSPPQHEYRFPPIAGTCSPGDDTACDTTSTSAVNNSNSSYSSSDGDQCESEYDKFVTSSTTKAVNDRTASAPFGYTQGYAQQQHQPQQQTPQQQHQPQQQTPQQHQPQQQTPQQHQPPPQQQHTPHIHKPTPVHHVIFSQQQQQYQDDLQRQTTGHMGSQARSSYRGDRQQQHQQQHNAVSGRQDNAKCASLSPDGIHLDVMDYRKNDVSAGYYRNAPPPPRDHNDMYDVTTRGNNGGIIAGVHYIDHTSANAEESI